MYSPIVKYLFSLSVDALFTLLNSPSLELLLTGADTLFKRRSCTLQAAANLRSSSNGQQEAVRGEDVLNIPLNSPFHINAEGREYTISSD